MTLPDSPNTAYTPDAPVLSVDLVDIQDCIVNAAHGDVVLDLHPTAGWPVTAANVALAGNGYLLWSAATVLWLPVPLRAGDRVKSLVYARYGDGTVDATVTAYKYSTADVLTILNASGTSLLDSNPAGAWADQTIDLTDTTLAAGESMLVKFDVNGGAFRLGNVRLTFSRPLP